MIMIKILLVNKKMIKKTMITLRCNDRDIDDGDEHSNDEDGCKITSTIRIRIRLRMCWLQHRGLWAADKLWSWPLFVWRLWRSGCLRGRLCLWMPFEWRNGCSLVYQDELISYLIRFVLSMSLSSAADIRKASAFSRLALNLNIVNQQRVPPFISLDGPWCPHWRMCCDVDPETTESKVCWPSVSAEQGAALTGRLRT